MLKCKRRKQINKKKIEKIELFTELLCDLYTELFFKICHLYFFFFLFPLLLRQAQYKFKETKKLDKNMLPR